MIRLRRLCSAVIDVSILAFEVIAFAWLTSMVTGNSFEDMTIVALLTIVALSAYRIIMYFLVFATPIFLYEPYDKGIIGNMDRYYRDWRLKWHPYGDRSFGMGLMGIYVAGNNKDLTYRELWFWRKAGFAITVFSLGCNYLFVLFSKTGFGIHDALMKVTIMDKKQYTHFLAELPEEAPSAKEMADFITKRPPIIKKDNK